MKPFIIGVAIALVIVIIVTGVTGGKNAKTPTANVIKDIPKSNGAYQEVELTFKNYQYELNPSTLEKDVPVRMTVDMDSVYGCMRDVVIKQFGVRQYVKEGDNIIEFTPDKAGTFNIACSMNMGRGTFEVAESDGTKSEFEEKALPEGSSCGSDLGCGGAA